MAWVRLDDSSMDHPKILKLSDTQFRLWVKGLCYCQKHLTDGFIPDEAIRPMLGKANDAQKLCEIGLWESAEGGFQVHDFLDWNDTRTVVQERREAREIEKLAHKEKMKRWRDAKKQKRDADCDSSCDESQERHVTDYRDAFVPLLTKPNQTTPYVQEQIHSETEGDRRMSGTSNPTIARRAGDFFEVWRKLFTEHRSGATYHSRPHIDYSNCCDLVRDFSNERLADLAVVFLNSNEPFIEKSNRSLAVFQSRVSWCDEQLRKAEAQQRRSA